MKLQADLFSENEPPIDPEDLEAQYVETAPEPLAVPCGWRDRTNSPCRRLGHKPVMMDGLQAVCRGRRLVHCAPECFSVFNKPVEIDDGV